MDIDGYSWILMDIHGYSITIDLLQDGYILLPRVLEENIFVKSYQLRIMRCQQAAMELASFVVLENFNKTSKDHQLN